MITVGYKIPGSNRCKPDSRTPAPRVRQRTIMAVRAQQADMAGQVEGGIDGYNA